jgi:uncharacterized protein YcaQ
VSAPEVPRRAVAALFLRRQWLDRPRGRRLTRATLPAFVAATCGLQIDSVNVVDRAHHLTLWSRFGTYDRAALERLMYRRRVVFEYLTHVACFVATSDLPLVLAEMAALRDRWPKRHGDPYRTMPTRQVEEAIAAAGVLGNADFERPAGETGGGWWTWKPATHALDYLWKAGRIAVHSRRHFHKRYAVLDRVLPQAATTEPLPFGEARRQRLLRSLAAMGAATVEDLRMYWTWPRWPSTDQRAVLGALVRGGAVTERRVAGSRTPHVARTADLPALATAARARRPSAGTTLLCPFDSFLWHRDRIERLWGFRYRIEIYVPGHQRTHGYYTLPLLHDGALVGRVDLKTHREDGVLEARHVHLEPWLVRGAAPPGVSWGPPPALDDVLGGLAGALRSLAGHVGATQVTLRRATPPKLRAALASRVAATA